MCYVVTGRPSTAPPTTRPSSSTAPVNRSSHSSSSAAGGGKHPSSLHGLFGYYECRAINVEPVSSYNSGGTLGRGSCAREVFTKAESLKQHQAVRMLGTFTRQPCSLKT